MCTTTPIVSSAHQPLYDEIYKKVVDEQLDPICRFQQDYRLTFVNQPYAALYGKRLEELIGQNMMDVIPVDYRQQVIDHLSLLSPQYPTAVDENPVYLADGSLHWFHWTNRLIEYTDGTIEYQGVGRDITARKQAEEAEREQRLYAEAMRDSLAALTSSLDVDEVMTQILASAIKVIPNDACRILLFEDKDGRTTYTRGYSPEALALLNQYSIASIRLADGSLLDGKHPYLLADVHTAPNWTPPPPLAWIRSSIGVPITVAGDMIGLLIANSATPNLYKPQDLEKLKTFAHYAGLALNNAYQATRLEQLVAERTAELRAAKEQVESILNHSSHAIILVQADLRIVQHNAVFETLFHHHERDNQDNSLLHFIHPVDRVALQDGINLVMRNDRSHHLQLRAYRTANVYFDVELSISKMDDRHCVCTLHDITERTARERQLLYYASMQESVNEAVIAVDLDYRIQSWNKAAETIFGWRATEVIGRTTIEVLRTLYSDAESRETSKQILFEQGYWQGEAIQHRKDGTPRNIAASITLLRDAQQIPFGMVAISRDITEQKQTEKALKESRYFTKQIADTAPSIIYVYDLLAQKHSYINDNIANNLGYSVAEFSTMGQRILSEGMHPDDLDRFFVHRKQLLAGKDEQVFKIENRMRHKNGGWRWFLMQDTIFQRTPDGIPTHILGVATDITESKQAAENLRHQRDFLQQIIDQVPAIIMVKEQAGTFQLANSRAAHVYSTTTANMVGRTDADVNPSPTEVTFFQSKDEEVFISGQPLFVPEQAILGTYYQINKIPLKPVEGEMNRLLMVAVDISTRKQAEVTLQHALDIEKELNEHKSHFISTVSHEFRTPLTIIQTLAESLRAYRHKLTDEQIAQRLDKIFAKTQYMTEMMKDVIELARIQARRVQFQPTPCNPIALCLDAVHEFQNDLATKQPIRFTHDTILSPMNLDQHLLNQILSNLLSNAIKYSTDDKPVLLHLAYRSDTLVLTVADQGIGIPAADMKYLFEPFYRATNVVNIPGTGLGLSITKEAVDLHGGSITVESQVGVGATFTVTLPVAVSSHRESV